MKMTTIKVASKPDKAGFRFHGMCVDDKLNQDFWVSQSQYKIGTSGGSFSYTKDVELSPGRHTVDYGVSTWVEKWAAEIYVNGTLMASGDITTDNKVLSGTFLVGPMGKAIPMKIPVLNTSMFLAKFPPITQSKSGILSNLMGILRRGGLRSRVRGK